MGAELVNAATRNLIIRITVILSQELEALLWEICGRYRDNSCSVLLKQDRKCSTMSALIHTHRTCNDVTPDRIH